VFGYVVPRQQELKVKELNLYKTVYCSLCRELKRRFGRFSALFLNYDFVFLSLLGLALENRTSEASVGGCIANPLRKQAFIEDEVLGYSAGCLVVSVFHKLSDDLRDEGFLRRALTFFIRGLLFATYKKAKAAFGDVEDVISKNIKRQQVLEESGESGFDQSSDPTALSLSYICVQLAKTEDEKRIISRLGYLLGRFVYLADAGDDLEDDIVKKRYNPLIEKFSPATPKKDDIPACIDEIKQQLLLVRGEIAVCYNLLDTFRYRPILDNIIFMGLEDAVAAIGQKGANASSRRTARSANKTK